AAPRIRHAATGCEGCPPAADGRGIRLQRLSVPEDRSQGNRVPWIAAGRGRRLDLAAKAARIAAGDGALPGDLLLAGKPEAGDSAAGRNRIALLAAARPRPVFLVRARRRAAARSTAPDAPHRGTGGAGPARRAAARHR